MKFLVPGGIGDTVWALHKAQAIAARQGDGRVELCVSGGSSELECRSLDFLRRFSFVESAQMRPYAIHPERAVSPEGYYNYIDDGFYDFNRHGVTERLCALMPNGPLERGHRLEEWLPQYPVDWTIFSQFRIDDSERDLALELRESIGPYAVFYPGPLRGNTIDGHNRGPLWTPGDWLDLGRQIRREFGLSIVLVGAPYDASYFDALLSPLLNGDLRFWTNLIGRTSIGELFSVTSEARFVISYQAGVGIVATYLGTPTAVFWRPHGDSISPRTYLSFEEEMASGWVPPKYIANGNHLPLIYRRHGVNYIVEKIKERRWAG